MRVAVIAMSFFFFGCAPYIGYRHDSNPHISNDGLDLVCAGNEFRYVVEVKAGICHVPRNGDNVIELQVDYFPLDGGRE